MKKLLLAAALLVSTMPAMAQEEESGGNSRIDTRGLRIGIFASPTMSWMRSTTDTDDEREFNVDGNGTVTGFIWGLMVDKYFGPNYAFATGLQYNSTGGKMLATAINAPANSSVRSADFRYRVAYVEVPLNIKLRTDDVSGFRFFGQLGITAGFNIGKKADYSVSYIDANGNPQDTSGNNVKIEGGIGDIAPFLLQLNVGAGTEYAIGQKLSAYVGIFFNNGFLPDATNPQDFDEARLGYRGEFRDGNTRLNNVALKLGLFF